MKKKILSLVLALCLIIPCALALTACGEAKPFSIAGKTLKGTSELHIVWKNGITEEEKEDFFSRADVTNEQELKEEIFNSEYGVVKLISLEHKADGTFIFKVTNDDGTPAQEDDTFYYAQSEDLKTIFHYSDAEHTNQMSDGFGQLDFYKGNYCLVLSESSVVSFYFVFKTV